MGTYIKGIMIPDNCEVCPVCDYEEGTCLLNNGRSTLPHSPNGKRRAWCPLVYVPPHGRLIDADKYEQLLRSIGNRDYRREKGTLTDAIKFLHPHYTSTVIPADEEERI